MNNLDPTVILCIGIGIVVTVAVWHLRDWYVENIKKPVDRQMDEDGWDENSYN